MMYWGTQYGNPFYGYHMGTLPGLFMILFWIILLVIIFLLIRRTRWNDYTFFDGSDDRRIPRSRDSSLEILKDRYARGELTKDQFDAMKRDLGY